MKKQVKLTGRVQGARVDAEQYADRLPLERTTLWTVAARLGLTEGDSVASAGEVVVNENSVEEDIETSILQALTHPSYFDPSSSSDILPPSSETKKSNALLSSSGRVLLDYVLTEFYARKYPNLPTNALKLVVTALTNARALADVGLELGVGLRVGSKDSQNEDLVNTGVSPRFRRHTYDVRSISPPPPPSRFSLFLPRTMFADGFFDVFPVRPATRYGRRPVVARRCPLGRCPRARRARV